MDGNGETSIFYVLIWFIIQLKPTQHLTLPDTNSKFRTLGGGDANISLFHPEPWGNDPI